MKQSRTLVLRSQRFEEPLTELQKVQAEKDNLKKALDESRIAQADMKKTIDEISQKLTAKEQAEADAKAKAEEKKLKDKEDYETLKTKMEEEKAGLLAKIAELEPIAKAFTDSQTKTLDELKAKIPEDKKEFIEKLLTGKNAGEQIELLPEILKSAGVVEKIGGSPVDKSGAPIPEKKLDEAKTWEEQLATVLSVPVPENQ